MRSRKDASPQVNRQCRTNEPNEAAYLPRRSCSGAHTLQSRSPVAAAKVARSHRILASKHAFAYLFLRANIREKFGEPNVCQGYACNAGDQMIVSVQ
jgi:hypothetical protein